MRRGGLTCGGEVVDESIDELRRKVDMHMRLRYRTPLAEMEPASTPGYWQDREPKMHRWHPLHGAMGCDGPFQATYTYYDSSRVDGKFSSRTRTWARLKDG